MGCTVVHLHKGPGHSALAVVRHQLHQLFCLHKVGNRALQPHGQRIRSLSLPISAWYEGWGLGF